MADLHGIMVALITPFTDDRSAIDVNRLQAHIERMVKAGIHGLVPGGSTGEFPSLTLAERKQLTELCVKFAAGCIPVVASTGGLTSSEALELSVHAAQAGAAAVMVVPPFYNPVNLTELTALMAEVHDAAKIPIA
jgi:dihydrodipicolinate synthase/N-acetylneuraminate lyase